VVKVRAQGCNDVKAKTLGTILKTRGAARVLGLLLCTATATASVHSLPQVLSPMRLVHPFPVPPPINAPPIGTPPSGSATILQASDITYVGAIRTPLNVDTTFAYGGMTGRVVNGRVHFFLYGNNTSTPPDVVYEIEDPGGGYNTDYRQA